MSKARYEILDGAPICTEFELSAGTLTVKLANPPKNSRLSFGGIFGVPTHSGAVIDTKDLPDGTHSLFLHTAGGSMKLSELEKSGKIISPRRTPCDLVALGKA